MGALKPIIGAGAALVALLAAVPLQADEVDRWRPQISEASSRFGVPPSWIERVMRAESRGRTRLSGRPIRSPKGAIGLMQLMPGTWAEMRDRLALGSDPDNPRDNILAGTFYLRLLYNRFGYPGLFAAYNAGPRRYEKHLAGRLLPRETVAYLAEIAGPGTEPLERKLAPISADGLAFEQVQEMREAVQKPEIDPLFAIRRDVP
ncbi:lytic transglycosylase domain-containing protein [Novosphingobium sp.]|uniref:lytic transglycosylase domain-containing protein n=1 Tax=Novosphingobium sp. TaxID=1874826 RepID=UPI0028A841E1|nr:lytic transglycosylase domain-containing protein [Novosphingobium sp.]